MPVFCAINWCVWYADKRVTNAGDRRAECRACTGVFGRYEGNKLSRET